MNNLKEIYSVLNYEFKDENLIKMALTHSSFANENKCASYERLEFLGDAVLEIVVSEYLYKNFDFSQGEMTKLRAKLVDEKMLSTIVESLNLNRFVLLGSAQKNKLSKSVECDVFESVVGAIFLDGGLEVCKTFVNTVLLKSKQNVLDVLNETLDYKTVLQEYLKALDSKNKIEYCCVGESGPDHNKHFEFVVKCNNKILGSGGGNSKKDAQTKAAYAALIYLKNSNK